MLLNRHVDQSCEPLQDAFLGEAACHPIFVTLHQKLYFLQHVTQFIDVHGLLTLWNLRVLLHVPNIASLPDGVLDNLEGFHSIECLCTYIAYVLTTCMGFSENISQHDLPEVCRFAVKFNSVNGLYYLILDV